MKDNFAFTPFAVFDSQISHLSKKLGWNRKPLHKAKEKYLIEIWLSKAVNFSWNENKLTFEKCSNKWVKTILVMH